MRSRILFIALGLGFGLAFDATVALAWTGPTASAPNSNIGAPVNVGTTAQIKNGDFGANNISAFGNALLSGLGVGSGRYLNFDFTSGGTSGTGSSGYGIRDNAGTLEFKNSGGAWSSMQSLIAAGGTQWTSGAGGAIYYNSGNVGIGASSPVRKLDVAGDVAITGGGVMFLNDDNPSNGVGQQFLFQNYDGAFYLSNSTNYSWASNRFWVDVNGFTNAAAFLYTSDGRLKKDVAGLKPGLPVISQLRPVSFVWKSGLHKDEADIGFIAQEVEKVVPGVVHTDAEGMKSIDYIKLTPILVKALQEQQEEIDTLQARVAALESK